MPSDAGTGGAIQFFNSDVTGNIYSRGSSDGASGSGGSIEFTGSTFTGDLNVSGGFGTYAGAGGAVRFTSTTATVNDQGLIGGLGGNLCGGDIYANSGSNVTFASSGDIYFRALYVSASIITFNGNAYMGCSN